MVRIGVQNEQVEDLTLRDFICTVSHVVQKSTHRDDVLRPRRAHNSFELYAPTAKIQKTKKGEK
jgi:hypothetical protein